jgi:hypothetical protein
MICFRDMSFCASNCANRDCRRNYGPEEKAAAREWWGGDDAPVALANFRTGCADYKEPSQ